MRGFFSQVLVFYWLVIISHCGRIIYYFSETVFGLLYVLSVLMYHVKIKKKKKPSLFLLKFHQPIMITVALMTLLGFLFILIEKKFTWSHKNNEYTHSVLGIIVVCLVFLNVSMSNLYFKVWLSNINEKKNYVFKPLIAMCRPRPENRFRCLFFWIHWLIGTVAYCLAGLYILKAFSSFVCFQ